MMKALSVVEMPGTAIACGKKTLEIRHWHNEMRRDGEY